MKITIMINVTKTTEAKFSRKVFALALQSPRIINRFVGRNIETGINSSSAPYEPQNNPVEVNSQTLQREIADGNSRLPIDSITNAKATLIKHQAMIALVLISFIR